MHADDNESGEPIFFFSLNDVKAKYFDFLNLTADSETTENGEPAEQGEFEEGEEQPDNDPDSDGEENQADKEPQDENQENSEKNHENGEKNHENNEKNHENSEKNHENNENSGKNHENEEQRPHSHSHGQAPLESQGTLQEMRDLGDSNPQNVMSDYSYWKPVIDHGSVTDLLSEMNK